MRESIVIINNEKCVVKKNDIYCQNIEIKSISEALDKNFDISLILRKSNINPIHKINIIKTKISSNIISFISNIIKNLKNKKKFFIISITPYTFIAFVILILFRKKIYLYLRSNGLDEYRLILGKRFVWIYRLMLYLMSKGSNVLCVNDKILPNKNYILVLPSQINEPWLQKRENTSLNRIKLLYVGRIKIEKGVFSLLKLSKELNSKLPHTLTLVGHGKKINDLMENVKLLNPVPKPDDLIKIYDQHNISILPSFTEGHPQVLLESLARKRPIIIVEDISYVKKNYEGVFVAKRNSEDLGKIINYVIENYHKISLAMDKNTLPSKSMFIKDLTHYLSSSI